MPSGHDMRSAAGEVHVYRPRLWFLSVAAAVTAVPLLVLRAGFGVGSAALWAGVVVVPLVIRNTLTLTTSPEGVALAKRRAAWSELALRRGPLSEVIETPRGSRPRSAGVIAQPNLYERAWRSGRLGADVRRWAPHLLDEPRS